MELSESPQPVKKSPLKLTEYQRRWVEDHSRFKIALKARQTGFSFVVALEAVFDCMERPSRWVLLSSGERQSKELMEKVATHTRAFGLACKELESDFQIEEGKIKMLEVILPNGSRIIGLPANPATARGFAANVVLDEFAFHRDSRAIWTALYPTITRGYKIRVISTPNGKNNMFYDIWTHNEKFSQHKVNIYAAMEQGLDINIDELKEGIEDADTWAQEFECQFIDEATAYLTYEMIASCEDKLATMEADLEPGRDYYLGVDIGRKKDLTIVWLVEKVGDVAWTRMVKKMEKTPFRIQRDELFAILPFMHRCCIDATGLGAQLAEEVKERFGSKAEEVVFTGAVKEDLAVTLRRKFEDKYVRIPVDRDIREDLHSIKRFVTVAGNVRFDAERSEIGHADRFWALALAIHASSGSNVIAYDLGIEPEERYWHAEKPGLFGRFGVRREA